MTYGQLRTVTSGSVASAQAAVLADTDLDSDLDGSDLWYDSFLDERWRMVATYRSTDADPKERFVRHQAGADGDGGSSYIDPIAFREKDANTAWTTTTDGTLEERVYDCQNQHADVVALVAVAGAQREMARYSAYGATYSDSDCNQADQNQMRDWALAAPAVYDVGGHLDRDGEFDLTDRDRLRDIYKGTTLWRTKLSAVGNARACAGYLVEGFDSTVNMIRHRVFPSALGVWASCDPIGYTESQNQFQHTRSVTQMSRDRSGLESCVADEAYTTPRFEGPPTFDGGAGWGGGLAYRLVLGEVTDADSTNRQGLKCAGKQVTCADCQSSHCKWTGCTGCLAFMLYDCTPGQWRSIRKQDKPMSRATCLAYEYWHHAPCTDTSKCATSPSWTGPSNHQSGQSAHRFGSLEFGPEDCGAGHIETWCATSPAKEPPNHAGLLAHSANGARTEQTTVFVSVPFNCA